MDIEAMFGPLKADNDNRRFCPVCDGEVLGRAGKVYCCSACQRKGEYLRRDFAAEKAAALGRTPQQICKSCGKIFKGIPKDGKPLRFCSKACSGATMLAQNRKVVPPQPAKFSVYRPLCGRCGLRFTASMRTARLCSDECRRLDALAQMRVKAAANDNKPPVSCRECLVVFKPVYADKRSVFCSDKCSRKSLGRIRRKAEDARLKAAWVEAVDPFKVFDRDRWRCQLCGVKTPRKLRGSYEPNAPELDHIMPLSLGGEHSYRNTQCACRACNGAKGATFVGQTRLFG